MGGNKSSGLIASDGKCFFLITPKQLDSTPVQSSPVQVVYLSIYNNRDVYESVVLHIFYILSYSLWRSY